MTSYLILYLSLLLLTENVFCQLPLGSGSFTVVSTTNNKSIDVYTYVPAGAAKNSSFIITMHGLGGIGAEMRNDWLELANQNNFIILAPNFGAQWTGTYLLAGLDGPDEDFEVDVLDQVFDEAKKRQGSIVQKYYFYGMSAGCQFVHRVSTFTSSSKIKAIVCASAGYYTLPDNNQQFPYGVRDAPLQAKLPQLFCRHTFIIVGGNDTVRDSAFLQTPEADTQGLTRVARAKNYYNVAKSIAKKELLAFNWKFQVIPGVGHNNKLLIPHAAEQFAKWDNSLLIDILDLCFGN